MLTRPLLVLDLDETLWHGQETNEQAIFAMRPYLREFLLTVSQAYDLAVWTAAGEDWIRAGLAIVRNETDFDLEKRAFFLWHRSRLTWRRGEDGEYHWRKPARKFRAKWIREKYPRTRILVLDDCAENYPCGYGHLVKISAWTGDSTDTELLKLATYLLNIVSEPNLTAIEKRGWNTAQPL